MLNRATLFNRKQPVLRYISTRGEAPILDFTGALLAGLARDGGLYLPETWPTLDTSTIEAFAGKPYAQVAQRVMSPFVGDAIPADVFSDMLSKAYAGFRHPATTPLVQLGDNLFVLELFHGPTLAFKDVAMQILGRMMDHALAKRGERATIVGATSGDTGAAAIEAFHGLDNVDVFILYPHGKVSEAQRRQMTTVAAPNVHALAIEGNFDDCQAIVKGLFNHHAFRDGLGLAGVNSINWARVMAQIVYYFTSAVALGGPRRKVSFAVPTGNFGDILAGYAAKRMGLPVGRLVVATNENDILERALASGVYETKKVHETASPSMDIQVSSNFERLLFEANGRDAAEIRAEMGALAQSGRFELSKLQRENVAVDFDAFRTGEIGCAKEIRRVWDEANYLIDPHTAVGLHAARKALARDPATPMVALATAHPAKFAGAIQAAVGKTADLPPHLADLMTRREHFTVLANSQAEVEAFMRRNSRAAS